MMYNDPNLTTDLGSKLSLPYGKNRSNQISFFTRKDRSHNDSQIISDKQMADFGGGRFTHVIDLGPLNQYYREGLGSHRSSRSD